MAHRLAAEWHGLALITKGYDEAERKIVVADALVEFDRDPMSQAVLNARTKASTAALAEARISRILAGDKRPRADDLADATQHEVTRVANSSKTFLTTTGGIAKTGPQCKVCTGYGHQHGVAGATECKLSTREDLRCFKCHGLYHTRLKCPSA